MLNPLDPYSFGPLAENHPLIGQLCHLCKQPLEASQETRGVINTKLPDEDLQRFLAGTSISQRVEIAHRYCDAPMTLKCTCCGFEKEFTNLEDAYQEGWDEPDHLSAWPVSCPLCPGVASLGMLDHSSAHERWKKEGRPANWAESVEHGDLPDDYLTLHQGE